MPLEDIDPDMIDPRYLSEQVRNMFAEFFRNAADKPWPKMPQAQQAAVNDQIEALSAKVVDVCVRVVAMQGRKVVSGKLDQVTVKDGLKLTIKVGKEDEARHALVDKQGGAVQIIIVDKNEFIGSEKPLDTEPDQRDLEQKQPDMDAVKAKFEEDDKANGKQASKEPEPDLPKVLDRRKKKAAPPEEPAPGQAGDDLIEDTEGDADLEE